MPPKNEPKSAEKKKETARRSVGAAQGAVLGEKMKANGGSSQIPDIAQGPKWKRSATTPSQNLTEKEALVKVVKQEVGKMKNEANCGCTSEDGTASEADAPLEMLMLLPKALVKKASPNQTTPSQSISSVSQQCPQVPLVRGESTGSQSTRQISQEPTQESIKLVSSLPMIQSHRSSSQSLVRVGSSKRFEYSDFTHIPDGENFVDAHCHLDYMRYKIGKKENSLFNTWAEMTNLYRSFPQQMSGCIWNIVHPGYLQNDPNWMEEMIKDPHVLGVSVGCHPRYVDKFHSSPKGGTETYFEWLNRVLEEKEMYKICAIGECGLESTYNPPPKDLQMAVLTQQLWLAKKHLLPVIIHCRADAQSENLVLDTIISLLGNMHNVHFHCAPLKADVLKLWMDKLPNCYFGFTPRILDNRPTTVEALRVVPLTRMLLESDAPYFATALTKAMEGPYSKGSETNASISSPAEASTVAAYIAQVKGFSTAHVMLVTRMNTYRFYNLDRTSRINL
ncbi:unnamed protein product, partial [Mesorhabditis belari]|uniref:Uncharacterized protein n=1 Tax=Mesorhabditis belari TaxID=2138241 RepID=A0AAF3F455_9BILA